MRGACCGSICQRIETSTCIPICSDDSASISSTCAPACGHCSSRVEKRSTEDQGATKRTPASSGAGSTVPNACRTPRVEKARDGAQGREEAHAGQQRRGIDRAERVPHADFARVDHDRRGAEHGDDSDHQGDVAENAEDAAHRLASRALAAYRRGAETKEEGYREEYETKD